MLPDPPEPTPSMRGETPRWVISDETTRTWAAEAQRLQDGMADLGRALAAAMQPALDALVAATRQVEAWQYAPGPQRPPHGRHGVEDTHKPPADPRLRHGSFRHRGR